MKTIVGIFVALMVSGVGLKAQSLQSNKTATHFFIVNMDENLLNVLNEIKNDKKNETSSAVPIDKDLMESIIDTFYSISSEKFKIEFGIDLLPLNELQSKIKYSNLFPNCPDVVNIRKVIKNASGYKFYTDYFVNIFSDINTDYPVKNALMHIRPLYAFCFNLYDATGKLVKNIKFSYKSKKPLADNRLDIEKTKQQMKAELSQFYSDALNEYASMHKLKLMNP